jgi:hypothetical protein
MLGVAYIHFLGFMNFFDIKLSSVTKYFINKSFNKLVKKRFRIDFLKLSPFLKKSMACVNIDQL